LGRPWKPIDTIAATFRRPAALVSTLVMIATPASVAGVGRIVAVCPAHRGILAAARLLGVTKSHESVAHKPSLRSRTEQEQCRAWKSSLARAIDL